ncbi:MAG: phage tail protein, partial [Prevotella sp.]
RWVVIAVAIPIVLFLILVVLLYCPPVQNWAVKRVASYASQKMGMNITVDRVRLVFPLDLGVEGVRVLQANDSIAGQTDTIANVGRIVANVQLIPLLSNKVEVDELSLHDVQMNTANLVHEARIKGKVGLLLVQSRGVDLNSKTIRVNQAQLKDANISVELSDTVPPDTTKTPIYWKIKVDKLQIEHSKALLRTPRDSMAVLVDLPKLDAKNGYFDLYKNLYRLETLNWQNGSLNYDQTYKPRTDGLDPNHIHLTELNLGIDSFYFCQPELKMNLRVCAFKEKSGVRVNHLSSHVALDSTRIALPNLELRTPESSLTAKFNMDMNAFDEVNPGKLYVALHASLGKADLLRAMGGMPEGFRKAFPNYPLRIDGVAKGNKERIAFSGLNMVLPTAFKLQTTGYVEKPMDTRKRKGEIFLKANTYNLNFAKVLIDKKLRRQVNVPSGISLNARAKMQGEAYQADATMHEGGGSIQLKGSFDARKMAYNANIKLKSLALQHFLPNQGLHPFTGEVEARGVGTDFMSTKTQLFANVRI